MVQEPSIPEPLLERWRTPDGRALAESVLRCLTSGEPLPEVPWGRHEGRLDLRGFRVLREEAADGPVAVLVDAEAPRAAVTLVRRVGTTVVRDTTVEGVDLSGADLESFRFFDTALRDCRFDGARCYDWRVWSLRVSDCSFREADLRSSSLGPWHGGRVSRWERVSFAHADLRETHCSAARFTDCDFSHGRMRWTWYDEDLGEEMSGAVDFGGAHFVRCTFAGSLDGVIFNDLPRHGGSEEPPADPEPNPMEEVDLSAASLRFTEFRGLRMDRVRLPADGDHVIVSGGLAMVRRARELHEAAEVPSWRLEIALDSALRRWHPERRTGVWHRSEFGPDRAAQTTAVDILRAAERDVREASRDSS